MLVLRHSQDLFPTFFNELFNNDWNSNLQSTTSPKMNVIENENEYQLDVCVPGLTKEDLVLTVDAEENLVIEMEKKNEKDEKEGKREDSHYLRHEFSYAQFKQSLALPENVKKELISAKVEHGVLHIVLPKVTEEEQKQIARTIEIA